MTTTTPAPHMLGGYAPVPDEITVTDLAVTGAIPPEFAGWYLRNGPNPREAESAHWFLGDGMVHGIRIDNGRATSYRNRWVRTKAFTDPENTEHRAPFTPCFVYHSLNAHEEGDGQRLVLHVIRYDSLGDGAHLTGHGALCRWTIDLAAGTVREDILDEA
jgi:carotenoid cleavage dioxygenase-like enzyme